MQVSVALWEYLLLDLWLDFSVHLLLLHLLLLLFFPVFSLVLFFFSSASFHSRPSFIRLHDIILPWTNPFIRTLSFFFLIIIATTLSPFSRALSLPLFLSRFLSRSGFLLRHSSLRTWKHKLPKRFHSKWVQNLAHFTNLRRYTDILNESIRKECNFWRGASWTEREK